MRYSARRAAPPRAAAEPTSLPAGIAAAAEAAGSQDAALRLALERVCAHAGWPVGHAFLAGPRDLFPLQDTGIWCGDPELLEPIRRATERAGFFAGPGSLPGRALVRRHAIGVRDLCGDSNFTRFQFVEGLRDLSAFAVPVLAQRRPVGVLEFFATGRAELSDAFLRCMERVGSRLGAALPPGPQGRSAVVTDRLERVSRKLIQVQEAERRRISLQLHDEVGQQLTATKLVLESLLEDVPLSLDQARRMARCIRNVDEVLERVRTLSRSLRPANLEYLGLPAALRGLLADHFPPETAVAFRERGEGARCDPEVETALYRIAQEAFSNITRHAAARRVSVHLVLDRHCVSLDIADDGRGFDADHHPDPSQAGLGLIGADERARLLGGAVRIDSSPGRGTTLHVSIPLEARHGSPDTDPGPHEADP